MKRLFILLPLVLASLIGCQSGGQTTGKVPYDKNYEFVVDVPGVEAQTIYDSIPLWLSSEFPEEDINSNDSAKNFAQTFLALNSPVWADSSLQNKKRNIKNVTTNDRDSGIFACSIKNVVIETQNQAWGAGGLWLVLEANIMVQVKAEKYRILWEDVKVNQLEISGHGRNSWVRPQQTLKKVPYNNLINLLENSSHKLQQQIEKISQDW